jgi:mono/diheme cytochrome c family protein
VTDQGTFYGPNITPDPVHGIGAWSYDDFVQAMTQGRAPSGHTYWPAFPYPAYGRLREPELADLWAYLRSLPASDRPDDRHAVRIPRWPAAGVWRRRFFEPGAFTNNPNQSAEWNRGAYLGEGIGHCGECHTPRNRLGALQQDQKHWGAPGPPEAAPDITPGANGLAEWDLDDLSAFLEDGMTAEGDVVGGEMARIVEHGTARLSEADRHALAVWLWSLPPSPGAPTPDDAEDEDDEWE